MWFRIEQNKDGSIATCTAVESSLGNRGAVHYIEADTAESACKILLARYAHRAETQRALRKKHNDKLTAAGLCWQCGGRKEPERMSKTRCLSCLARTTACERLGRKRGIARTPEDKAANELRNIARRAVITARKSSRHHTVKRVLLERLLETFDQTTPRLFREWLAEELHKAREAEQASAQRRAARITKAA